MKTLLLIFGFIMFFGLTNQSALSQEDPPDCPQGFTLGSITRSLQLGPNKFCDGIIWYCWRDNENGQREIIERSIRFLDYNCLTGYKLNNEFWENVTYLILSYQANLPNGHPEKLSPEPCDDLTYIVKVKKSPCWKFITGTYDVEYISCINYQYSCEKYYALCWDYSTQTPTLVMTQISAEPINTICGSEQPYYSPDILESGCFSTCFD